MTNKRASKTSFIQTDKGEDEIALLANEWATLLQCLLTCVALKHEKHEARKIISLMM